MFVMAERIYVEWTLSVDQSMEMNKNKFEKHNKAI